MCPIRHPGTRASECFMSSVSGVPETGDQEDHHAGRWVGELDGEGRQRVEIRFYKLNVESTSKYT